MSAAFRPRRALPYAPHWLMPTPCPKPPPSTVTVSPELARPKRSDGNAIGRSPGIGKPLPLALEMKSPIAMLCVAAGGGGAVVGGPVVGDCDVGAVGGGGLPGTVVVVAAVVEVVGGGAWRTWYTRRSLDRLADTSTAGEDTPRMPDRAPSGIE